MTIGAEEGAYRLLEEYADWVVYLCRYLRQNVADVEEMSMEWAERLSRAVSRAVEAESKAGRRSLRVPAMTEEA